MRRTSTALAALLAAAPAAAEIRPFTPEELLQTRRLDDVQLSNDGKRAAFTVRQKRLDENRDARDVWLLDLPSGTPRQFTRDGHSDHPRFSPDGTRLLIVSDRGPGAEPQLYLYDLDVAGDARKLTSLHTGGSDGVFSPDGRLIAFVSEVIPQCTGKADEIEACIKKRADEKTKSKVRARVVDRLLFRHWNEWRDNKRNHVFVMPLDGGPARDLTPGDADWPTWRLGGGGDLAFSRDGRTLYLSHKKSEGEAWRTNSDIYAVPVDGGQPRNLTEGNAGDDASPAVSPDGRWLAWKAQARNGYESDLWKLRFMNLESGKVSTVDLPEDAGAFRWKRDSSGVVAEMAVKGRQLLHSIAVDGRWGPVSRDTAGSDFAVGPDETAWVVVAGLVRPPELYRFAKGAGGQRVTRFNDEQYGSLNLGAVEEQWVESSDGAKVHSWIVKPANVKRAPLLVLVHGGPQGAWEDAWSMRWNAALFAARGYIVLMPNPRGSTSYGPKFKEEISQDWGGKVYDDVMRSVDAAEKRADVEPGHTCAAGASYGGYFINWTAGHTDRFKCLVSHAGVFDLVSDYGTTEELWFPEWEFGGPYWQNMEHYRKFSPSSYVQNFKTPTLVTMGEMDFRVPMEQPFQMFTALQRRGVESRLLSFPDEGHWINKPRNSLLWYRTVLEWIDAHAKGAPRPEAASAVR